MKQINGKLESELGYAYFNHLLLQIAPVKSKSVNNYLWHKNNSFSHEKQKLFLEAANTTMYSHNIL